MPNITTNHAITYTNTQLMTLFLQKTPKVRLWSSFVIMWNIMNTAFSFTRLALSSVNNLLKNISFLFLVQFYSSSGVTIQQNNILTKMKDLIAFIYYPLFSSMKKVDMMKENQKLIVLIYPISRALLHTPVIQQLGGWGVWMA